MIYPKSYVRAPRHERCKNYSSFLSRQESKMLCLTVRLCAVSTTIRALFLRCLILIHKTTALFLVVGVMMGLLDCLAQSRSVLWVWHLVLRRLSCFFSRTTSYLN